jgi:hypothetical protein
MARRRSHLSRSASFRRVVCKWTEVDRNTSRVPVKVAERVNASGCDGMQQRICLVRSQVLLPREEPIFPASSMAYNWRDAGWSRYK